LFGTPLTGANQRWSQLGVQAYAVMVNSGDINGVPAHDNHRILTDILSDDLGIYVEVSS